MQLALYSMNPSKLFGFNFGSKSKIEKQARDVREFARAEGVPVSDILVAINRASYSKAK